MGTAMRYQFPSEKLTDTKETNKLHPELPGDAGKLCMYVAMAGASDYPGGRDALIQKFQTFRNTFKIPYDDDVFALILAYMFDFRFFHKYDARRDAETGIADDAKDGDRYFISIMAKTANASGHAIYAKKATGKLEYIDNENADKTQIAQKFTENYFMVFKSSGNQALAQAPMQLNTRIAHMPESLVTTIAHARSLYSDVQIDSKPYADHDVGKSAEKLQAKATEHVTTSQQFNYASYSLWIKAAKEWDEAMPKT
jgi:hypothetical protein